MSYTEDEIKQLIANELGAEDGIDFTSETDEMVKKINTAYPLKKNAALQKYKWGFAEYTSPIDYPIELEDNKYKYRYTLPCDFLRFISASSDKERNNTVTDYDPPLRGYFDCNTQDKIYLTYIADVDAEDYPDYFVNYLVLEVATSVCKDLTGDNDLLQILATRSQNEWKSAINVDTIQKRTRTIRSNPYLSIRG